MKRWLKIVLIAVCCLFMGALVFISVSLSLSLSKISASSSKTSKNPPLYHFALLVQNTDDTYWQSVTQGAQQAAKDFHVAVEVNGPKMTDQDEQFKNLDIAVQSHVDGIATYAEDSQKYTSLISSASDLNIPVVTIKSDDKDSKRKAFIGTASYDIGTQAGQLVVGATNGSADVAVILGSDFAGGKSAQDLLVNGLVEAAKGTSFIRVRVVEKDTSGYFDTEELVRNLLLTDPNINAIVCTDSSDTVECAQVIVDLNKVDNVSIIGYSDSSDILDYINKNVIYGTVVEDPYKIGYDSIRLLIESKKGEISTNYEDTGVHTITKKDLEKPVSSSGKKK